MKSEDIKICEKCKYWEVSQQYPIQDINIGICRKVKLFWDCTKWDNDGNVDIFRVLDDKYKDDRAFVQDGSDYMAKLLTRAEFGCNQFDIETKIK